MAGPPNVQPPQAAATGLAHVIVALAMLAASPLRAQTLGAVLAEHGVTAPADARDVDRQDCTGIRSAPVCTDVRLEEVRAQNPGVSDHELLVRRLGGG